MKSNIVLSLIFLQFGHCKRERSPNRLKPILLNCFPQPIATTHHCHISDIQLNVEHPCILGMYVLHAGLHCITGLKT